MPLASKTGLFAFAILFLGLWVGPSLVSSQSTTQLSALSARNVILFYDDYPSRGDSHYQVTKETARPLVAHVDQYGKPTDWMFDTFVFYSYWLYRDSKPNQKYIDSWIKYLFDGQQISNLDSTVAEVKAALGKPNYQMNVFLAVPVDYNIVKTSNILRNVEELINRWNGLNPRNLVLIGFYWGFTESFLLKEIQSVTPDIAKYLHSKGLKFIIKPYSDAAGIDKMHSVGFDYILMQPNYAWDPKSNLNDFKTVNDMIIARYVDGIEFEISFGGIKCCGGDWRTNLQTYFERSRYYSWTTNSMNIYYHGADISVMGRNPGLDYRTAYETVYQHIVKTRQTASLVSNSLLAALWLPSISRQEHEL